MVNEPFGAFTRASSLEKPTNEKSPVVMAGPPF